MSSDRGPAQPGRLAIDATGVAEQQRQEQEHALDRRPAATAGRSSAATTRPGRSAISTTTAIAIGQRDSPLMTWPVTGSTDALAVVGRRRRLVGAHDDPKA